MDKNVEKRDYFIDIVRAIGIISIVLGHCCWTVSKYNLKIGPFVYSYHLMIFMFTSGYMFKYEKVMNGKNDFDNYIIKQVCNLAKLYFIYNFLFVLFHNMFVKFNMISANFYSFKDMVEKILNGLFFSSSETLLGAFWFIPVFLIAKILFVCSLKFTKNEIKKNLLIMSLFGIMGVILIGKNINLIYKYQISIVSVFFMYLGYICSMNKNQFYKKIYSLGFVFSMVIINIINYYYNSSIELSINRIINPLCFFIISVSGIYFCLSFAKILSKNKFISQKIAIVGKNSFHIMALHFLVFKVIDLIYCFLKGIDNKKIISQFPRSFGFWYIYLLLGTIIPICVIKLLKSIKKGDVL